MRMRKFLASALVAVSALALVPTASSASTAERSWRQPPTTSKVYVVHGLPLDDAGTIVDVYAGAAGAPLSSSGLIADNFAFGTTAGPLELPAADYTVSVAVPTASDDGVLSPDEVIFSKTLSVPAGKNLSAVASFDGSGNPTINVFTNDTRKTFPFLGRLSIRHAAAAPAVKVDVGIAPWARFFPFLTQTFGPASNGQQADTWGFATTYDVGVKVAANGAEVAGVKDFALDGRTLTAVYAVGVPGSTFQFVVQKIQL